MFETKQLILRGYRPTDEDFFLSLFNDYDILVNLTTEYVTPNIENHRVRLEGVIKSALCVVVEEKGSYDRIGLALVDIPTPRNLDGEVGIALKKQAWGKGYASEVMEWLVGYSFKGLGLRRLSLFAFSSNTRAIALYEKIGFKHEGRKREAIWKEGEWVDYVWMGLLSREYPPPDQTLETAV
ncbi:acyl-CoA N-acyltransferase [Pholiota conissans]|uniref:Acyl-CoA N-acyltransferase n=1 Tax=Pholiota conissans TaxID=109636 RepID=A0A9P5YW70_9AGAR|nr:acyl-CoA N-acyltransferase [Pholiota conissans]